MTLSAKNFQKPTCYLLILLLFIFADIVCDNYVLRTFNKQSPSQEFFLFLGLLLLQFLASPIQAGISDYYSRKKSITVALLASLLAIGLTFFYNLSILAYFPILIFIMLIKGILGNTIPLAWASIADTKEKNFRFSFGLSTASFAVGYFVLTLANKYLTEFQANLSVLCIYFILPILSIVFFKDIRNILPHKNQNKNALKTLVLLDIKSILHQLKKTHTRNGLYAFFLWEVSLYSILLLYVDFDISEFSMTAISMMIGYLLGVLTLKFCDKIRDEKMIKIGYGFSVLSLIPFIFLLLLTKEINYYILSVCYFFHTFGNAFLCSTFFAIISKEGNEQGKSYGIIESCDTASFLVSSIIVILYKSLNISLGYLIFTSLFTAIISWAPYQRFDKLRPKTQE